jgi:hypothetical protein
MVQKSDWFEKGTELIRLLDDARPRQRAAVLQVFSRDTDIAISYARRIVSACRAVQEIQETNSKVADGLRVANVQAVAAIWRWLAYDKAGALAAARDLIEKGTTVRALEEAENWARRFGKNGTYWIARRSGSETTTAQRRMRYAEGAFAAVTKSVGSARLEWMRPGLLNGHRSKHKLPFMLAWLDGLPFGHLVFEKDDGQHVMCHIVWPRELARRETIRAIVLMAIGLSNLGVHVCVISSDEAEIAEATAILKQRVAQSGGRVEVVRMDFH